MNTTKFMLPLAYVWVVMANSAYAKAVQLDVRFKNLYADRNFEDTTKPSVGSWSQGVMLRADTQFPLQEETALTFSASAQYAQRLSHDKHINDMILPFDPIQREQAQNYYKIAGSIGIQHHQHKISWGEQWVDTPLATTDYSRQLATIYQGIVYSGQPHPQLKVDLGYLDQYSPRNEEHFRKLSVNNKDSDGLSYIDIKYTTADKKLQGQLFLSELKDLYNQYSLGLQYKTQYKDFNLNSKLRYYYNTESGNQHLGTIDNQYYGFLQEVGYGANTLGMGIQKIEGKNNFPMLDGAVPVLSYINWTQGTFNKANELSYHFTFNHNASWLLPGLNILARYVDGQNYILNDQKHDESEFDLIVNYQIPEGKLKGLGFQWLNINYRNDLQGNYSENRFFTTYALKF